jgi:hypothetical protein
MQTGSSGTLIGWKSGQTTFVPLWDRMEGAWLRTQLTGGVLGLHKGAGHKFKSVAIRVSSQNNTVQH